MKKSMQFLTAFLVFLFVFSAFQVVTAVSTADARNKPDSAAECSLMLRCLRADGQTVIGGLTVDIYYAASLGADLAYALAVPFDSYPIAVNALKSQSEWNAAASTFDSYVTADRISALQTAVTDEEGMVTFSGLGQGLYFVKPDTERSGDAPYSFPPFLIAVPGLSVDGLWLYDVSAVPKPCQREGSSEYKVIKYWIDNADADHDGVTVGLYKNGEPYKTVILNDDNQWMYEWVSDEADTWIAVELNVPDGYTVTTEQSGNVFAITNTADYNLRHHLPHTGDSGLSVYLWTLLVSGTALFTIGLRGTRKVAPH